MPRKRTYLSVGLVSGFVLLILVGLVGLVKREPAWYGRADLPAGEEREDQSQQALSQFSRISSVLADPTWEVEFTAAQINAFFQEDYLKLGGDDNLPDGFHDPRVLIDDDKLRVGVRYGSGLTSTVMSIEVRVWKVVGQINTLAMEIVSLQAGSLPLSTGTLLDYISQAARRENIDVIWFRHRGHPVAIMRFQADQPRPTFQFDRVEFRSGVLTISGQSTDPFGGSLPPPRTMPR